MSISSRSSKLSSPNVKIQDVPNVPTIGTPIQVGDSVNIPFIPATTGGQAAVYRAISNPGGVQATSFGSSPITFSSGLTGATNYTFTVRGETPTGATTGYSSASSSITTDFGAYQQIATTLITSNTANVTFSSIPQTYRHLQIRYTVRDAASQTTNGMFLEYNGNTVGGSNSQHNLRGDGSTSSGAWTNVNRFDYTLLPANSSTANSFSAGILDLLDYSSTTKNKTTRVFHGYTVSGSQQINLWSGMWNSTAAINQITMYTNNALVAGTRFSLYGIKG
jgi:hypothetical protein